ncbi:DNA-processing protein DprA [Sphingobacterium sp. SRCM116780]|uniref:DNA-processing protein DprA n=1 Tax=Sphingobacterium sp. SRCM116780 TaxID=2907623 RepID=UPI001F4777F4|nr:DNA-processing protein DprA [Sphingobacterium sp. SRCM116780]UIR55227.1 DNA-processing protein DprA [Sphingobacterium sp. SRCM116780]
MSFYHQIALTKIKGVGPKTARNLLAYCGSVQEILETKASILAKIPGVNSKTATEIAAKNYQEATEKEIAFVEKHQIQVLWITNPDYPTKLRNCEDAPLVLYYKGNADLNNERVVSIVGTRDATNYGRKICDTLIEQLKPLHTTIVSGLAYGIDIAAHKSALLNQIPTVAVLGHGLDRIYPASHRETASNMIYQGGLLTEFASDTKLERQNFPMRNRIIAGMADVTIVIEAAIKGGALITAEIANSYNRDVCAFPGGVDQTYSAGCNYLIKTNRAHLIRDAQDLCYLMNWDLENTKTQTQLSLIPTDLNQDQLHIYHFIKEKKQVTIDKISRFCNWSQSKLAIVLLEMEMNGHITSLPGKVYTL